MFKIILDPNLFECEEYAPRQKQLQHYYFLKKCVEFLDYNCDVCIDSYNGLTVAPVVCRTLI